MKGKKMKILTRCKYCSCVTRNTESCSECKNIKKQVKTVCGKCGTDIEYNLNRYITHGNFCRICIGVMAKLPKFTYKETVNNGKQLIISEK